MRGIQERNIRNYLFLLINIVKMTLRRGIQITGAHCLPFQHSFISSKLNIQSSDRTFGIGATLHLLMRNLKFYEIALDELPRKSSEGTDFRATKLSRETRRYSRN